MTVRPLVVLVALQLGVLPALAQRQGPIQRWPTPQREATPQPRAGGQGSQGDQSGNPGRAPARERQAEPRSAPPPPPRVEENRPPVIRTQPRDDQSGGRENNGRQAVERDANSRRLDGNRDGRVVRDIDRVPPRVAIPRQGPPPRIVTGPRSAPYFVSRPPVYYYTPRFNRPYVYGALGPGYFYYGSFGWYPRATYFYDGGYFGRGYAYDLGEVRLRVEPRWAEVYVDGFFAGTVDDFDGTFQSLKLESGPYHVEIVAPGYETLEVDLRLSPGQKITYRGVLRPEF